MNAEGHAMLVDFGIARLEGQGSDAAAGMTAGYASPEQAAGRAPGPASDIFSLGRLLAELVRPVATGQQPAELAAIVARATAHDAAQRYESAGALQRDLLRLLSHQPVAEAGGGAYALCQGLRRHWLLVLAGVTVLGVMSAVTARLAWQLERAQTAEQHARQAEATLLTMQGPIRSGRASFFVSASSAGRWKPLAPCPAVVQLAGTIH